MRYLDSLTDFFKSPRWTMNILFAAVCSLIPLVGPIVLHGWLIGGFWGRDDSNPETFPDFDFNRFTKYLTRGLWSFLVSLVFGLAIFVMVIILEVILIACFAAVQPASHGANHEASVFPVLLFLVFFALYMVLILLLSISMKPFLIRAEITQNFGTAFDFRFALSFLKLTWIECLISTLFIMAAGMVMMAGGMLLLCIGMYFVIGPLNFMMCHLNRQIYQLYLSRGGEPVPFSPALRDTPPPLPA